MSHICQEDRDCCCSMQSLEPDEDCPKHGWPWPPRCGICGRFMKRKPVLTDEQVQPNIVEE